MSLSMCERQFRKFSDMKAAKQLSHSTHNYGGQNDFPVAKFR